MISTEGFDLTAEHLAGTGTVRPVGCTVYGTATHFIGENGNALCGAAIARDTDADEWVSCTRCMKAARA